MKIVSPNEVCANRDGYYIIDIREPYEYEVANIKCPNIPMAEVCDQLNDLPKDKIVVLMCQSGNRASALGNLLTVDFELQNVAVMEGGIKAWKEQVDQTLLID